MSRLGEERLGAGNILRTLRLRGVEWVDVGNRMVVAHGAAPLPHCLDYRRPVQKELHREADPVVVEGLVVGRQDHGLERRALHGPHGDARRPLQGADESHRHLEHHLDVAAAKCRHLGGVLRDVHLPQLIEVGPGPVPVVRELHQARALARLELD